jgi:hypothetical protein
VFHFTLSLFKFTSASLHPLQTLFQRAKGILPGRRKLNFFVKDTQIPTTMADHPSPESKRSTPGPKARAELAGLPGLRHLGASQVRRRTGTNYTETVDDYVDIFQELQIDREYYWGFWHDVLYRYRQQTNHAPLLKRGTEAAIRTMSDEILRAYGYRTWGVNSAWRAPLPRGDEMLVYDKDGDNSRYEIILETFFDRADFCRLHGILDNVWWRMRELVYEEKPAPKHRGRGREDSLRKRALVGDQYSEGDETYLVSNSMTHRIVL